MKEAGFENLNKFAVNVGSMDNSEKIGEICKINRNVTAVNKELVSF